jgi:hypothetical protein
MKSVWGLIASTVLSGACAAQSVGNLAEVSIIDRDSGVTLTPYFYRGEYWVAGRPGARYSIEVRNRAGERLLAVTSVDGVNVLSGATAAWSQEGYVFNPFEDYQITGWRKSDTEVAAFTFTALPNSYAARTGRPANVGVVGVALFRELPPPAVTYSPPRVTGLPRQAQSAGLANERAQAYSTPAPAATPPAAPAVDGLRAPSPAPEARAQNSITTPVPEPAAKLGTGHGEREYSYVNHTVFARLQSEPNEIVRIHYDSLDNLLAMGIIKRQRPVMPSTDPFPASPGYSYVPDPPG